MANVSPVEVQKALQGMDYPARRQELVSKARQNGASADILAALEQLPDHTYETPADVNEAIGARQ